MAFCTNCGASVSADEKFCHSCGTALNAVQVQNQSGNISSPNVNPREDSLKKITAYHDYFSQYEDGFRYYLYCEDVGNTPNSKLFALKFCFIIIIIYGCFATLCSLVMAIANKSIGYAVFTLITDLVILLILFSLRKKIKAIKTAKNDLPVITENLTKCYENFGDTTIGIQYVFPWILRTLYEYVQNGRADTIKEAINIYETELHNKTMRELAAETAAAANDAANNARKAANNAKRAANYASASFWLK